LAVADPECDLRGWGGGVDFANGGGESKSFKVLTTEVLVKTKGTMHLKVYQRHDKCSLHHIMQL